MPRVRAPRRRSRFPAAAAAGRADAPSEGGGRRRQSRVAARARDFPRRALRRGPGARRGHGGAGVGAAGARGGRVLRRWQIGGQSAKGPPRARRTEPAPDRGSPLRSAPPLRVFDRRRRRDAAARGRAKRRGSVGAVDVGRQRAAGHAPHARTLRHALRLCRARPAPRGLCQSRRRRRVRRGDGGSADVGSDVGEEARASRLCQVCVRTWGPRSHHAPRVWRRFGSARFIRRCGRQL
mmetsp:Transcript_22475/g.76001  ORF Transcript_22475/g.76001 Transcript_22475/m.76001 type:complete len:237 (+) Transcript_22475:396-1106(+)